MSKQKYRYTTLFLRPILIANEYRKRDHAQALNLYTHLHVNTSKIFLTTCHFEMYFLYKCTTHLDGLSEFP